MLGILPSTAHANTEANTPSWYQIEFVIFEHLQTDDHILRYEDVPYPKQNNKAYTYVTQEKLSLSEFRYSQLPIEQMVLGDAYRKLKRSRETAVLEMKAWQQPLSETVVSPPLKIEVPVSKNRRLFGEVQLKKSRYTHADFNVYLGNTGKVAFTDLKDWLLTKHSAWHVADVLTPYANSTDFLGNVGSSDYFYNLRYVSESRRIKDGEIHYIDHPTVGIIVTIKEVPSPHDLPYNFGN